MSNSQHTPVQIANGIIVTPTSLEIKRPITDKEWYQIAQTLARMKTSVEWAIADFIAYSELTWNEKLETILPLFDYTPQTLRNMAWVARKIPPEERDPTLSFSHHRMVAGKPKMLRTQLLKDASQQKMSVMELFYYAKHPDSDVSQLPKDSEPSGFEGWWNAYTERKRLNVSSRNNLENHVKTAFLAGRRYERFILKKLINALLSKKMTGEQIIREIENMDRELEEQYNRAALSANQQEDQHATEKDAQ